MISRRRFALIAGAVPLSLNAAAPLTAEAIVRRIQTELGGEWPPTGTDGFKAGDPSTVVEGIATTAMATMDVLKQAVKANANLVVTYEPTFHSRADAASGSDPVVKAKLVVTPIDRAHAFHLSSSCWGSLTLNSASSITRSIKPYPHLSPRGRRSPGVRLGHRGGALPALVQFPTGRLIAHTPFWCMMVL
jgi:hypothetical protein